MSAPTSYPHRSLPLTVLADRLVHFGIASALDYPVGSTDRAVAVSALEAACSVASLFAGRDPFSVRMTVQEAITAAPVRPPTGTTAHQQWHSALVTDLAARLDAL